MGGLTPSFFVCTGDTMKYKITNLSGTRHDPKKKHKTSATSKPVRVGTRTLPPAKSMFISLDGVERHRSQLAYYLKYSMIAVSAPTLDELELFHDTVNGKADEKKEAPKKEEPKAEAKPEPKEEPTPEPEPEPEVKAEEPKEEPKPKKTKKVKKRKAKKKDSDEA